MDCRKACQLLLKHLLAEISPQEHKSLMEHLKSCERCRKEMEHMLKSNSVVRKEGHPAVMDPACKAFQELLPEAAEMEEEALASKYPRLFEHLKTCPECSRDLRILRDLIAQETKFPPESAVGDWGSCNRPEKTLWQEVQAGVRRIVDSLRIKVRQGKALLEELPFWLEPRNLRLVAQPAVETRGPEFLFIAEPPHPPAPPGPSFTLGQEIELPDEEKKLSFRLQFKPETGNTTALILSVKSLAEELKEGIGVTLKDKNQAILEHTWIDLKATTVLEFLRLKPDAYMLEIEYQGARWEIPLDIFSEN